MTNILSEINGQIQSDPQAFIARCEAEYHDEIRQMAQRIIGDRNNKIVLIAGPSGSGKTTTAHILQGYLEAEGMRAQVISLDNFYKSLDEQKLLPDGSRDFESVDALDLDQIHTCFENIIKTGKSLLPVFDFTTGKSIADSLSVDISDGGLLIVEGIHGLNPLISGSLPSQNLFRIYVSVKTPILDDSGNVLLTGRKIRLIRRTLRDFLFRASSIENTLELWTGVVEAEERYLSAFKRYADFSVTTLHPFELAVYKEDFIRMAQAIRPGTPNRDYALLAAQALTRSEALDSELVPANSLIREFIGGKSGE